MSNPPNSHKSFQLSPTALRTLPSSNRPMLPAWLWAPCGLYAISAACILVGISKVIVPLYDKPFIDDHIQKFHCLIALNLYEIALLGVALLILLWRQVYDDAIALTLLIAIFLIASAIALDTIAPDFPLPSLLFGIAALVAAGAKLFSLHRFITGPLAPSLVAGIGLLLAGNFLMPGLIALANDNRASYFDLIVPWRLGWYAALIGGGVLLIAAMRIPTSAAGSDDIGKPFLRTVKMHWIIAAILLAGTITQHYALTWAFNIPIALAELSLALGIIALIVLELLRAYGYQLVLLDAIVCLVPLVATALIALLIHDPTAYAIAPGSPSDPAVALALFAAAVSFNGWRREQPGLQWISAIHLAAAVLLVGIEPQVVLADKLAALNWNMAGFTLGGALALHGLLQRNTMLATLAAMLLAVSAATSPWAHELVRTYRSSQVAMMLITFGALMQLVYCWFRRELPPRVALIAAIALAIGVIHMFFPHIVPMTKGRIAMKLDHPMLSSIITLIYIGLVALWTRDWHILIPACVPLLIAVFSSKGNQGWTWVAMSFIVLALGAVASIRKSWREGEDELQGETVEIESDVHREVPTPVTSEDA